MEYADNGDIQSLIADYKKKGAFVPESLIWDIFSQLLSGLACLHRHKIVHRDIKCANVFLTSRKGEE